MPTIRDNAICLRQWDYSETSQTVRLFSREHGILRGLAKGSRRDRSAFSGGFEPLTRGEIMAIVKRGRDLATLTEWKLEELFRPVHTNLTANRASMLMVDLVGRGLTDADPHPELFDALLAALRVVGTPGGAWRATLRLQWALLEATGVHPELSTDVQHGTPIDPSAEIIAFDPRSGGVTSEAADGLTPGIPRAWPVRQTTVDVLRKLAAGEPWSPDDHDDETILRACRLLAVYQREVIGQEIPTLRWAFGDDPLAAR